MSRQEAFKQLSPIAYKIARSFKRKVPRHIEFDDLLNVALLGVWEIVSRKYDQGLQAMTYLAHVRAKGAIIDYLRSRDWSSRYARKHGRSPTIVYVEDGVKDFELSAFINGTTPEDRAADTQIDLRKKAVLEEALALLQSRDAYVMRKLLAGTPQVMIAKELKLSGPRMSQILHKVLPQLKAYVKRASTSRKLW